MTITRLTISIEGKAEDKDIVTIANKAILIKEASETGIAAEDIIKTKEI